MHLNARRRNAHTYSSMHTRSTDQMFYFVADFISRSVSPFALLSLEYQLCFFFTFFIRRRFCVNIYICIVYTAHSNICVVPFTLQIFSYTAAIFDGLKNICTISRCVYKYMWGRERDNEYMICRNAFSSSSRHIQKDSSSRVPQEDRNEQKTANIAYKKRIVSMELGERETRARELTTTTKHTHTEQFLKQLRNGRIAFGEINVRAYAG